MRINGRFLNRHKNIAICAIAGFVLLIISIGYGYFIEPKINTVKTIDMTVKNISEPIKIIFIADLQLGGHKKDEWTKKITQKIQEMRPDLLLIGGDLIDNSGTFEDESKYLEPFKKITSSIPTYYILGNHEYGISSGTQNSREFWTGNRSHLVIKKMKAIGANLLMNDLECVNIKNQNLCLFGIDDIWNNKVSFEKLKNKTNDYPLIFLTHNPDGVKLWPENMKKPELALSGHTHGGQISPPFIGPLGDAEIELGRKFYKGLNEWNGIKIFTTVGIGESGGQIRFGVPPEIVTINLKPPT
jgi:predicted MPP superfamily phosphohydrolase